ncbi:MAG: thioredoxin family protein, partial [Actinomycetota bacterium]|nr:thioredoxin family protein [Actinomycetota bacterium]
FPYLKDDEATLARGCGALTTPHAFVFDSARRLRYRGRLADSRDPARASVHDLTNALDDLLSGRHVAVPETAPTGCSIVW